LEEHDIGSDQGFPLVAVGPHRPVVVADEDYLLVVREGRQPFDLDLRKLVKGIVAGPHERIVHIRFLLGVTADGELAPCLGSWICGDSQFGELGFQDSLAAVCHLPGLCKSASQYLLVAKGYGFVAL